MPYVNVQITREGATAEQKAQVIKEITQTLVDVLDKDPETTFVVIDEIDLENWGVAGLPTAAFRTWKASKSA
jgi:4-oxalocrotonate tautomerase